MPRELGIRILLKSPVIGKNLGCGGLYFNSLIPDVQGCPLSCPDHVRPSCTVSCNPLGAQSQVCTSIPVKEEETKIILHVWGWPSNDISSVTLCSNSAARTPGPRGAAAGSEIRPEATAARRPAPLWPPGLRPAARSLRRPPPPPHAPWRRTGTCTQTQTP